MQRSDGMDEISKTGCDGVECREMEIEMMKLAKDSGELGLVMVIAG